MKKSGLNRLAFTIMIGMGLCLAGCAGLVPNPEDVVKTPFGTESVKIGMTKQQVEALWGKPNEIRMVENRQKWQGSREAWIYHAQYTSIPVNAGYLSKDKTLYFDGNNLTNIGE